MQKRLSPDSKKSIGLQALTAHNIPIGFGDVGRRQMSEAPLSPWMECILSNVRNVASSSLRVVGDWGE
ncbi:hypothetical protein ACH42_00595 [Endozoicomonas sp. (ex Bugula neritina AB1)]|nr:hypothetical protein ACH42_00595 [Endozoicomonas sp. (ex Bugula neritina AB1)]